MQQLTGNSHLHITIFPYVLLKYIEELCVKRPP
jgi:hypothetical protein